MPIFILSDAVVEQGFAEYVYQEGTGQGLAEGRGLGEQGKGVGNPVVWLMYPVAVQKKEILLSMTWVGMADKSACRSEDVCWVCEKAAQVGGG